MHTNSKLLFEKYALPLFKPGMRVLEIGPDDFPSTFAKMVAAKLDITWHTLDIYQSADLTYSCSEQYRFAVSDDSYDIVISGQVIEHVQKPWIWIKELSRVAVKNGLVITINPVSWYYHEAPVDCWRIYPEGMKALYDEAGLTVLMSKWESLETANFSKFIPGISWDHQELRKRLLSTIFGKLGLPVERAYDTITIGQKSPEEP